MKTVILYAVAVICGLLVGWLINLLFGIIPDPWLQDYGVTPDAPDYRPSKRMKMVPHGIVAQVFAVAIYVATVFFCKNYFTEVKVIHIICIFLIVPLAMFVMMSDRLNRIIPDQFTVGILLVGILAGVSDFTEGNIWFSENAAWYIPVLNRVIAAIAGGGILWIIGFISITFAGKEGMGQGDMKLLAALGAVTGCYGLVVLFYVAVFSALFFAIPLIIKKQKRIREEEEIIRKSDNPSKMRRQLQREKAKIHFADDPDYLAFGPFLAFGAVVFLCLEPFFFEKMFNFIELIGVYF